MNGDNPVPHTPLVAACVLELSGECSCFWSASSSCDREYLHVQCIGDTLFVPYDSIRELYVPGSNLINARKTGYPNFGIHYGMA